MQPLSGITVLDLTQFLSGPYCTMLLGDFGAEVIKIERPGVGDSARDMGPIIDGESYPFALPNRNKRSLAIDLTTSAGRNVVQNLAKRADIIVENFRPGVTARLGVAYDIVRQYNPNVVYCSITGFGQTGPESRRAGFDIIAQGMVGFLRMTGEPGTGPAKFGIAINDLAAGLTAANAILAAYIHRLRDGNGQYIDVSLVDAGLALTVWEAGAFFGSGEIPQPSGTRHRRVAPYQAFETADGYVTVGANTNVLWAKLCRQVLNLPGLLDRPEYASVSSRAENADQLEDELQAIFQTDTTAAWVDAFDDAGVPGGPVFGYEEILRHDQTLAREMVIEVEHPTFGNMSVLGMPAKMSGTPPRVHRPAPLLGQHTREVLTSFGYDQEQINELTNDGVVK